MSPEAAAHPVRVAALARLPALRGTYPEVFRAVTRGRVAAVGTWLAGTLLLSLGVWRLGIEPARLLSGFGQMLHFLTLMLPPEMGTAAQVRGILWAMAETLAIAFLGTTGAAVVGLPLALLAARNATIGRAVRFAARRVLDSIRGVDVLIWALIWVSVVGLGPFAGVLAILTSDTGTFGKIFSEAIEAADRKPQEGVVSAGGDGLARIRFGILPEVLPVLAGQWLYFFESNARSSTIIGIVGAGGIGLQLAEMIRTLEWPTVSFIILLVLLMVAAIDQVSGRLRRRLAGGIAQRTATI